MFVGGGGIVVQMQARNAVVCLCAPEAEMFLGGGGEGGIRGPCGVIHIWAYSL